MKNAGKVIGQYAVWGAALATGIAVFELTYDAVSAGRKAIKGKLEAKAEAAEKAETEEKAPEAEDTTVEE